MFSISQACPRCQHSGELFIENQHIRCKQPNCGFSVSYRCPICDSALKDADFVSETPDPEFQCQQCKNKVLIKKIKYLLDNSMIIDRDIRCEICNGPTVCRQSMNLGHRCFFFPKCSGQASLFGEPSESLVFVDFETTGLDPTRDSIIEIGALKIDSEGNEHTYQSFIHPKKPVSEKITSITGITNEMVASGISIQAGISALIQFIGNAKIVVHNAEFDIIWLVSTLLQLGYSVPNNTVICTLRWAKSSGENRAGLGALTKKYGISHANAHRALADAASTKELYFILKNQKKADRPTQSLDDFVQMGQKVASFPSY